MIKYIATYLTDILEMCHMVTRQLKTGNSLENVFIKFIVISALVYDEIKNSRPCHALLTNNTCGTRMRTNYYAPTATFGTPDHLQCHVQKAVIDHASAILLFTHRLMQYCNMSLLSQNELVPLTLRPNSYSDRSAPHYRKPVGHGPKPKNPSRNGRMLQPKGWRGDLYMKM